MKTILTLSLIAAMSAASFAQIDPNDPTLGIWLKTDNQLTVVTNEIDGLAHVLTWVDSSAHGTMMTTPLLGEALDDPQNHMPLVESVNNNGLAFTAVRFRQSCDPITPDIFCTPEGHLADRLWQTNNLGASDPTAVEPSSDLTLFVVYEIDADVGFYNAIVAKRGPGECPYELSFKDVNFPNQHTFIDYAGTVVYPSGLEPIVPHTEWGLVEVNLTGGGVMTFREYYKSLGGWRQATSTGVARSSSGTGAVSTPYWSADGVPFSLGSHTQSNGATPENPLGGGAYERLAGKIAEVVLYRRTLGSSELADVEDYLLHKYIIPPLGVISATRSLLQATSVNVVFTAQVTPATATNVSNYSLNNGLVVSAATLDTNGSTVVLTTSPLSNSVTNILTVSNVQDLEGNIIATNTQALITVPIDIVRLEYSQGGANQVVLEAEHYNLNTPAVSSVWDLTTFPSTLSPTDVDTNYSGDGAMIADPNVGLNLGTPALGTVPANSPRLDFKVQFTNTGTFYVWVRGVGDGSPGVSANDSVFIGLDGALTTRLTGFTSGQGYTWANSPVGDSGPIVISSTGIHVINVWMREDGFVADKILLSSDSGATPSGLGPTESPAVAAITLAIAKAGSNITLSWTGGGVLQSSTNVIGTYVDISGATSPYNTGTTNSQIFYRVRQ